MDKQGQQSTTDLTADEVADYLKQHPDYFHHRDDLLAKLSIPHQRGDTISLVERQVTLLRERNSELNQRLGSLVTIARDNDQLFEQCRRLLLALMESDTLDQVADTLEDSLLHDFRVDYCSFILINDRSLETRVRMCRERELSRHVQDLLSHNVQGNRTVCGRLRADEASFLFSGHASMIASAAVTPLHYHERLGILALGSRQADQFRAGVDTLFVRFIADALGRILGRLM